MQAARDSAGPYYTVSVLHNDEGGGRVIACAGRVKTEKVGYCVGQFPCVGPTAAEIMNVVAQGQPGASRKLAQQGACSILGLSREPINRQCTQT